MATMTRTPCNAHALAATAAAGLHHHRVPDFVGDANDFVVSLDRVGDSRNGVDLPHNKYNKTSAKKHARWPELGLGKPSRHDAAASEPRRHSRHSHASAHHAQRTVSLTALKLLHFKVIGEKNPYPCTLCELLGLDLVAQGDERR